jgi:hypothetical protein
MEPRRRSKSTSLSLMAGMLMTLIVPVAASGGADQPKIAFLNPSGFSNAGERGYIVSDAPTDSGPGCCDASDGLFRFSAWVAGAPPGASVFFTVVQGALDYEIVGSNNQGGANPTDTWDAQWDMPPEVLNGPAEVNAYLVLDNEPIAQASLDVTIVRVAQAVDIAYPSSGGAFGVFSGLANALPDKGNATRKKPIGIIDALYTYTPDAAYVRAFYTTSTPGTVPEWKACATDQIQIFGDPDDGIRCTIESAPEAAAVTAVGAVVNSSPGDYDPRFNQSGDAVRVTTYQQQPAQLSLNDRFEQRVSKNADADVFYCSRSITATVSDQVGRAIPGANIDVKAVGPTDGLKFHTSTVFSTPVAPDRGGHTVEPGYDCSESSEEDGVVPTNPSPDTQGEHPLFGNPDVKHVESPRGTNDTGNYSFMLHANAAGVTQYTVWVDEADDGCGANDDRFTLGEVADAGSIGWNDEPFTSGVRAPDPLIPCGDVTPSPDPTDPPDPVARTVGIRTSAERVARGAKLRIAGRVRSEGACVAGQAVTLKARRPGGKLRPVASGRTTDAGRYRFEITVRRTRDYRAVLPAEGGCAPARSRIVRVKVVRAP